MHNNKKNIAFQLYFVYYNLITKITKHQPILRNLKKKKKRIKRKNFG